MSIEQMLCELDKNYKNLLNQFNELNEKLESRIIQSAENDEFIDIKGVVKITGYATQTIYDLKNKGEIPSFKVGSRLRFKKTEIIKWMLNRNESKN